MIVGLILWLFQSHTYEEGLKILNEKGSEEAIQYFKEGVQRTGDPNLLFGLAWVFWESGEHTRAEDTCRFLLSKSPPKKVEAKTQYLLGFIASERDPAEGIPHLEAALKLYESQGEYDNQFKTKMGLAFAYFQKNDKQMADDYLDKALLIHQQHNLKIDLGWFYSMKARVSFLKKEFEQAQNFTDLSLIEYEKTNSTDDILSAKIAKAFFELLLGQYEEAYSLMSAIDKEVINNAQTKLHVYNTVNWILYYNCLGGEKDHLVSYVNNYLTTNKDGYLPSLLDIVQKHCE